jgi:hypothetical protein
MPSSAAFKPNHVVLRSGLPASPRTILREVRLMEDHNFPGQFRVVLKIEIAQLGGRILGYKFVDVKGDLHEDDAHKLAEQFIPMKGQPVSYEESFVFTGRLPV